MSKQKIENPKLLAYIHREVPKIINSNPMFVRIFGSRLAKEKIIENVLMVYTNEESDIHSGYFENKNITICSKGKFGRKLKVKDVKKNRKLLETIVHECIHAILYREDFSGTGILSYNKDEEYDDKEESEAGRGLNEGYTVWLCKKLGFKGKSYRHLTNTISQIECAIGTERTMRLGKGIKNDEFYDDLGMEKTQGKKLIALTDDIYWRNLQIKYLYEVAQELMKDQDVKKIKEALKKFEEHEEYELLGECIEDLQKKLTRESMIEYMNRVTNERENRRNISIWETEKLIFREYFLEDFIMYEGNLDVIPIRVLRKLKAFQTLLNSEEAKIPEEEKDSDFARFIKTLFPLKEKEDKLYGESENFRKRIRSDVPSGVILVRKTRDGNNEKII